MEPIFPRWTNKVPLYAGIGIPLLLIAIVAGIWYYFSPEFLAVGYKPEQPVLFSHELHAGGLGLDCRYCHNTVEKASFAALPTTATCMGCHNKVLPESPRLQVVRDSYKNNKPIPWVHIYALPRYAHFDHSAHVSTGVGCVDCHGRVDKMLEVQQATPLSMGWCLDCHRNPTPHLRPQNEVTNMLYDPHTSGYNFLLDPKRTNKLLQPPESCGACHY